LTRVWFLFFFLFNAEIIRASSLPLSIIIVGVGSADFTEMNALDSDDGFLRHQGVSAARDIVQFVPMRDFVRLDRDALARATLKEVPGQILSFFKARGFAPNPPRPVIAYVPAPTQEQQPAQ
jgi:hypothetical protein